MQVRELELDEEPGLELALVRDPELGQTPV